VVLTALEALDPLTQIREQLDKEVLFVKSERSGLTRLNPLVRIEERQLKLLMKQSRKLALYVEDFEPFDVSLPGDKIEG